MYNIIENIIRAGDYKLTEMQHKIKKLYLLGDLTEEQTDQLLTLAAGHVSTDGERPAILAMLQSVGSKIEALTDRVAKLEGSSPDEGGTAEGYPAWEPWDGISSNYQHGAIVSHHGKLWRSDFTGQNVWEPGAPGTEALWSVYNS